MPSASPGSVPPLAAGSLWSTYLIATLFPNWLQKGDAAPGRAQNATFLYANQRYVNLVPLESPTKPKLPKGRFVKSQEINIATDGGASEQDVLDT
jgi:hypothetical protein